MNAKRISKLLSLVLRHDPGRIGLTLDAQGWAEVDALLEKLEAAGYPVGVDLLEEVVATNNKQRFRFSDDGKRIRANQGHSIDVELGLSPAVPPQWLFHGTATRFLEAILKEGLKSGSRQHVHLSRDVETAVMVGKRHGKPVVLRVKSGEMHEQGHSFFLSDNGVWLTDHVPAGFLEE